VATGGLDRFAGSETGRTECARRARRMDAPSQPRPQHYGRVELDHLFRKNNALQRLPHMHRPLIISNLQGMPRSKCTKSAPRPPQPQRPQDWPAAYIIRVRGKALPRFKVHSQRDDLDTPKISKRQNGMIAGHDDISTARDGAFKDSVVGLVGKDVDPLWWVYHLRQLSQVHGHASQFLSLTAEFRRKDPQQLVEDRFGENKRVPTIKDSP